MIKINILYHEKKMKRIRLEILCIIAAFFISCGTLFPTSYARIDEDRVRILDYSYEPAETAPGKMVTVSTIFAGEWGTLFPHDINWTVSFNLLSNNYGVDTALDSKPLMMFGVSYHYFSKNTLRIVWSFRIPDSVVFESASIPENWTSLIPAEYQPEIPAFIKSLSRNEIISFIHDLAQRAETWGEILTNNPGSEDSLLQADSIYSLYKNDYSRYIPALLQILTIRIRLISDIRGVQKVRSTYSVRYNSCFAGIPGSRVYVNKNPVIDSIGIYKVKKENLQYFDPEEGKYEYEFIRLFGEDHTSATNGTPDSIQLVEIDRKCSYFVAGFAGEPDSSLTIQSAVQNGPATVEGLATQWYFQLDSTETVDVSPYDFMNIANMGNFIELLHPPDDEKVKTFVLWLEVSDYLLNEINRPQGSTLKEVMGRFTYSK